MACHLILFDNECSLCERAVSTLIRLDKHRQLLFTPLQGKTARQTLRTIPPNNSLLLIENWRSPDTRVLKYGKATLRILWHIGGPWRLLGFISFLPTFFIPDLLYLLIARHRHSFSCPIKLIPPDDPSRFLP